MGLVPESCFEYLGLDIKDDYLDYYIVPELQNGSQYREEIFVPTHSSPEPETNIQIQSAGRETSQRERKLKAGLQGKIYSYTRVK